MTLDIDRDHAKTFGDLHEAGESAAASFQDRHNNSWGREWASDYRSKKDMGDMCLQDSHVGGFLIFQHYD